MGFHENLLAETQREQAELLEIPFVAAALRGDLTLEGYRGFLAQAYHHVKHTVPLLMAAGARIAVERPWLGAAICEYIDEEKGHDEWILDDIREAGGDADAVRNGSPDMPCELLVSYAYDQIHRVNPLGFFGMVHVLEGTSVRAATRAARALQEGLGLPPRAFTYLTTHGELDQEHVGFFAGLMDRIEAPGEQAVVLHAARTFFKLYGDVFRRLPTGTGERA